MTDSKIDSVSTTQAIPRQVEEISQKSEEEFKSLVWDMQVGVLLQGPNAEIILSNPKALELLGINESQLLGKTSFDPDWNVIHADNSPFPGPTHPVPQAIATRLPVRNVVMGVYRPIKGDRVWLLVDALPQLNDDGTVKHVVCTFINITDRKQAEDALRDSEEKYRILLENLAAGVVVHAPDSSIIFSNPMASTLLGLTREQMQGKVAMDPAWRFIMDNGETMPFDEYPVNRVLSSGVSITNHVVGICHSDLAAPVWVQCNAYPVLTDDGLTKQAVVTFTDITERKQAEEELKAIAQRLNLATSSAKLGIWDWDLINNKMIWDDEMLEFYGLTKETFPGGIEAWQNGLHPEDRDKTIEECQAALRGEKEWDTEFRVLHPDGTIKHIKANGVVILNSIGTPVRMLGTNFDITERKLVEQSLRESEEKFRLLYTSMDQGLALHEIITDADGKPIDYVFIDINDSYTRLMGVTRDMAIGKRIREVMPKVEQYWIDVFGKVAQTGESCYYENYLETTGKHYSTYTFCPKKNQFAVLVTDISERKKAEELRWANEARYRAMVANITDVIAIIDQDGNNQYKSPNIEKWFGWHPDDVIGMSTWEYVHPGDQDSARQLFGSILNKHNASGTLECRYRCKDGSYKWIELTAINLIQDPYIRGVLLNYHDITPRKMDEKEKARLEAQLQQAQKMESVGRLAGGVAHDFNNMLGVILGHTEMALEEVDSNNTLYEDLTEIRTAANRSADLTRQLLAFARKQTVSPKVLDLNDTLMGMHKMLRRLIGENIDLVWMPGVALWQVSIDPSQIDQMLVNLCVNARDAITDIGRITIETGNCAFDEAYCADHPGFFIGDYVRIAVSDTGCGMNKETQAHIFEPFFTTKGIGKGTGLGLATVYGAVKQNNGFITAYSESGQGTTFTIYLPRHKGDPESMMDTPHESTMPCNETILLVEDEPSILKLATMMLTRQGYSVLAASTAAEAIRLVGEHSGTIHLIVTDVVMPEMNGRDLASNIQALCPGLKLLFMSGYTADVIARQGVLDQGVHFIQKPFSKKDLIIKVREAIDSK